MCSNILCKQKRENMLIKDQRGVGQMKYTAIYTHNLSQRLTHTPTGTRHSRDCGRAPCWRRKASCWKVPSTCAVHLTVSRCSGAERRQRWPRAATARAWMQWFWPGELTGHSTLRLALAARTQPIFPHLGMCMLYFTVGNFFPRRLTDLSNDSNSSCNSAVFARP